MKSAYEVPGTAAVRIVIRDADPERIYNGKSDNEEVDQETRTYHGEENKKRFVVAFFHVILLQSKKGSARRSPEITFKIKILLK
jgi:hypothetical protein